MSISQSCCDVAKQCANCREVKPLEAFAVDRSRSDGRTYWCRPCRNERGRSRHVSRSTGAPKGPAPIADRDGDRHQARRLVNHLIAGGRLPRPNDLPCADCGHVWVSAGRRHEYDHHMGYGAGHHKDVEAVCTTCHHRRERERRQAQ